VLGLAHRQPLLSSSYPYQAIFAQVMAALGSS
jgi:hypothetical protein